MTICVIKSSTEWDDRLGVVATLKINIENIIVVAEIMTDCRYDRSMDRCCFNNLRANLKASNLSACGIFVFKLSTALPLGQYEIRLA